MKYTSRLIGKLVRNLLRPIDRPPEGDWWRPSWRVIFECVTGAAVFGLIAYTACCLDLWVKYLEHQGLERPIGFGLRSAARLLFIADLLLFSRMLWRVGRRTWSEL
jgi:hypothetical protein